jgi:hypothetical protein
LHLRQGLDLGLTPFLVLTGNRLRGLFDTFVANEKLLQLTAGKANLKSNEGQNFDFQLLAGAAATL